MNSPLLLGVRHHGPGSARAVDRALSAYSPHVLLIEGPPEADALVRLAAEEHGMRPPVALLAHAVEEPGRAAFWPLAAFSPEWVAIRWALRNDVPVRFVDLPAAHTLAMGEESGHSEEAFGADPLATLARLAGQDDAERWWEDVVEHRGGPSSPDSDPYAPFAAVAEAMAAMREGSGGSVAGGSPVAARDLRREAHMRLRLREAGREYGAVAVVCGAWHVPALAAKSTVTADRQLLKGLPKVRTEVTWVPWTHRRLVGKSGYGAGIASPGWYGHLFAAPDRPVERWMTRVAGLLREEGYGISSAHVIEAVRLAGTLAVVRGRPLPGLPEATDAVRAVMCEGSDVPLALIQDGLVVGDVLGEVPEEAPGVPLQRDLTKQQRSLRLKPEAAFRELDLDLRKDTDASRSRLLHRLALLGIGWGRPSSSTTRSTGTFRESWRLRWEPELSVRVAEAGMWGTTVEAAATAKAASDALAATELAALTALAEQCLLAGLPDALPVVMRVLADRAALDADVGRLARALPALVRSVRYGDVRGTDSAALTEVAAGLAERICVGLPPGCVGLDADGAAVMRDHLDAVHRATALLEQTAGATVPPHGLAGLRSRWQAVLRTLAERESIPGLIRGRCARLLLDDGRATEDEAARLMGVALSPGTAPAQAAAWTEGFLSGGGMLLVHDERLLALVDDWLSSVPEEKFTDVLPLLRRTFAEFEAPVRRTLGELVRRGRPEAVRGTNVASARPGFGTERDLVRADAVVPTLLRLLGAAGPGTPQDTAGAAGGTASEGVRA